MYIVTTFHFSQIVHDISDVYSQICFSDHLYLAITYIMRA
jgi:hypothetical protein